MLSNIKNIVSAISAITGLLGMIKPITELIKDVEASGASGPDKKAAVLALVQQTILTVESAFKTDLPDGLILGFAGGIIDIIVGVLNMLGVFKPADPTVTPVVATKSKVAVTIAGTPIVAKAAEAGVKSSAAAPMFAPIEPPLINKDNFKK